MSKTRISLKERGEEPYDQHYLEALADALSTDVVSLLARDPEVEPDLRQLFDTLMPETRARALEVVRALKIADEKPTPDTGQNARSKVSQTKQNH